MTEYANIYPHQVEYLLRLFDMTRQDLLDVLNENRKRRLVESDVYGEVIKHSTLKAIDKVFHQGLDFYFDSTFYDECLQRSALSKKPAYLTALSSPDKQLVARMENRVATISGLSSLCDIAIPETMDKYSLRSSPAAVADKVWDRLDPSENNNDKEYLAHLIDLLAHDGVLVIEHVDYAIKKERRANLAGFFIMPNFIVLVSNMFLL